LPWRPQGWAEADLTYAGRAIFLRDFARQRERDQEMKDEPEKVAAILVIGLLTKYRNSSWPRIFLDLFRAGSQISQIAEIAPTVLGPENLPLEPYMRWAVGAALRHFVDLPLPTEQELTNWIVARGGISALLVEAMAENFTLAPKP
jgi:hypothetical protein